MSQINLFHMPFSTWGAYLAFSMRRSDEAGQENKPVLCLNNLHGASQNCRKICELVPVLEQDPVPYEYEADEWELRLKTVQGNIQICFESSQAVLLRGQGIGLLLRGFSNGTGYDYAELLEQTEEQSVYLLNCDKNQNLYRLRVYRGNVQIRQKWNGKNTEFCDILVEPQQGEWYLCIQELRNGESEEMPVPEYDQAKATRQKEFEAFYHNQPSVLPEHEPAARLAAYLSWSSMVDPCGILKRPGMLMSKNWMTNVWSWDHCFNAIALAQSNPEQAWDQFMLPFDFQQRNGVIPDYVNDMRACWNFCKPPIHGWALSKIMEKTELSRSQYEEAYDKLSAWTDWWFQNRDHDHDGICEYHHGNDSGWDNSTVFGESPVVESPDLSAFLILQMEQLSRLAGILGKEQQEKSWKQRSEKLLEKMLNHFVMQGRLTACRNKTHETIENESLLLCLPVVLGNRLPDYLRHWLVKELKMHFSTEYGFATEAVQSPAYQPDGYWRGPIWAPVTLLIIDGLIQCGETDFAREMAEKFCQMASKSGFAENFDACTGEGLRDRAYTWTSSVFLELARWLESLR